MKKYIKQFKEMAYSKKDILIFIMNVSHTINIHIIKILLFPQAVEVKKWSKEIADRLVEIQNRKCKMNNNYLAKEIYFENLYTKPLDTSYENNTGDYDIYYSLVQQSVEDNKELDSPYSFDLFPFKKWNKLIEQFFMEISIYLEKGEVSKSLVIQKINQIFL